MRRCKPVFIKMITLVSKGLRYVAQITLNMARKFFRFWKSDDQEDFITPTNRYIEFKLTYRYLHIGTLKLENGAWSFIYSQDFINQNQIKPLPDFPDTSKEYTSSELYPFFALRIPGSPQLKSKGYKSETGNLDQAELLHLFGQKSISNPFVLQQTN